MTRLTALVPGSVCAAALGRAWPEDLDGQVRCIDEGTRALGLTTCCAPWSTQAEDAALRAELGAPDSSEGGCESFGPLDGVAAGLARTPSAPPVLGLLSGPVGWSVRYAVSSGRGAGTDEAGALEAASDLAAARVQALAYCGAERVAVLEHVDGCRLDASLAAEMHRPILRIAGHLHIDLVLVATGAGGLSPGTLGYRRWVSADRCSDGLAFLPSTAFESPDALERWIRPQTGTVPAAEVVTAPVGPSAPPDVVRSAAALVAGLGREC